MADKVLSCATLVVQLSQFLPFCGLSYLGLMTGCDVDAFTSVILEGKLIFFSLVSLSLFYSAFPYFLSWKIFLIHLQCIGVEDSDDYVSCFTYVKHGASLAGFYFFSLNITRFSLF